MTVSRHFYDGVTHEFYGMTAVVDKAAEAVEVSATELRAAFGLYPDLQGRIRFCRQSRPDHRGGFWRPMRFNVTLLSATIRAATRIERIPSPRHRLRSIPGRLYERFQLT